MTWADDCESMMSGSEEVETRVPYDYGVKCKVCCRRLGMVRQSAETLMLTRSADTSYVSEIEYYCPSAKQANASRAQIEEMLLAKYDANPSAALALRIDRLDEIEAQFSHKKTGCFDDYIAEISKQPAREDMDEYTLLEMRHALKSEKEHRESISHKWFALQRQRRGVLQ